MQSRCDTKRGGNSEQGEKNPSSLDAGSRSRSAHAHRTDDGPGGAGGGRTQGGIGALGGCAPDEWYACGKLIYPGETKGGYGVDVDGFYVGSCGLYTDYGYLRANSGWYKINNYTHIDIYGSWC